MQQRSGGAADRFTRVCETLVGLLPRALRRFIAPTLLGFALINSFTFAVDLVVLTVMRSVFGVALWLSITVGYVLAFGLSFLLNRTLNFHSHAPIGKQAVVYAVVVVINYLAFILGVGSGLAALGLEYHVARVLAGGCEAVYMYCAMRWIVFRRNGSREDAPRDERQSASR
ncbi:GtrA family protein [Nocardia camponoti]|uniref:GtrA family protein n=1 Tax=Nocardia camponoti TaxID=1616106 RepID=UPI00166EFAC3|nr:GtrA family protein [Nocardia camponoti]